jgi:hypothetical protein
MSDSPTTSSGDVRILVDAFLRHLEAGSPERPLDDDYLAWQETIDGWSEVVDIAVMDDTELSWLLIVELTRRLPSDHWEQFVWLLQDVLRRRADEYCERILEEAARNDHLAFLLRNASVPRSRMREQTAARLSPYLGCVD